MKRLAVGSMTTPEYDEWRRKRNNDNIPELNMESVRPMEEYLQVIPSELEIIKQDFEKRNLELEKKIERLEEEKMHLRLDVDVQKLEAEKLKKGKNKVQEDLNSLKTDYKRLRKETLERQVLESQNYQADLKARIAELEKSLAVYRSRNSVVELRTSLCKIKELAKRIEELEYTLQGCRQRIEFLEGNEVRWREKLHHSQNQIQNMDYIMGRAIGQVREVADHLQTMGIQADVLSVKYELESDRGQELASLLKEVRALSIRAKRYL
ncbi:tropomyosin-like [Gossypium hirsutum]|uniref:Tropomyosin-like n=1 Tax=Gossypium hirsutum TaxID=3635 RepID=A0A1U8JK66_GOSHI|nr:tropomyosin-like [Gossypium hirsutum]